MGNLNLRNLDNRKSMKTKKSSIVPDIYKRKTKQPPLAAEPIAEVKVPTPVFNATDCKIAVMIAVGLPGMGARRFFHSFAD